MSADRALAAWQSDRMQREQRVAAELRVAAQRLAEAEARLKELRDYRGEYHAAFTQRAVRGLDGVAARDFRVFLHKLDEAIALQTQRLATLQGERERVFEAWRDSARELRIIERLRTRRAVRAARALERRDQRALDDRPHCSPLPALVDE